MVSLFKEPVQKLNMVWLKDVSISAKLLKAISSSLPYIKQLSMSRCIYIASLYDAMMIPIDLSGVKYLHYLVIDVPTSFGAGIYIDVLVFNRLVGRCLTDVAIMSKILVNIVNLQNIESEDDE
jgi:hypothetical protein